jgi:hypothetical protein
MTAQKLCGLLAAIGFVKWLLRTDREEAGILTLFFFACWWCSACRSGQGRPARNRRQAGPHRAEMKKTIVAA